MAVSESTYETLPPSAYCESLHSWLCRRCFLATYLTTLELVIVGNEQIVYHRLANNWDSTAIPLSSLGTALENWGSPNAKKIHTWKQYCQLQVATEKRWNGKGRSNSSPDVFGRAQRIQVHRIKIDTEKSLLVMSGQDEGDQNGSLVVHCLQDPSRQALFYLDQISIYAHVEMSNGFVVFTCGPEAPDSLEVWRWAEDQDACPLNSTPTAQQQQLYRDALSRLGHDSDRRGVLVPMGILKHSDETRASRLVYPTVCVGNRSGDCLSLWDVRTRKLTQTIDIEPSIYPRYRMSYVDVNETHVFVATHTVSVYSRATGQLVGPVFTTRDLPGYTDSGRPMISGHRPWDVIVAVHVSPDGNDFVAITSRGHIFHISGLKVGTTRPDDETASRSPLRVRISATQAQNYLENLAYDGQRILAYGTARSFMVQLGDGVIGELYPFPAKDVKLVAL
ncbi:hypothetical protein RHS01_04363 [Rhizoctonia solani]|uniref:Uncharacterized protein n=1 Tax=Rhizoctonia solani TaxID=456999 RepID=A0A8H7IIK9_9AGAM|nr:hypothetical protein RHS01_04363 [Rhizoctonia solani]